MVLRDEIAAKMAVDLLGAEIDETPYSKHPHRFHEMERAFDVHAKRGQWRAGGRGDTHDGRAMDHGVRLRISQCLHEVGPLGHLTADRAHGRQQRRDGAERRTLRNVEGPDLTAAGSERPRDFRTDEAAGAGYEEARHADSYLTIPCLTSPCLTVRPPPGPGRAFPRRTARR